MILLNEKEYAEQCLRNNDIGKNPYDTIVILSKYYYHVKDYKPKKIKVLLKEFLELTYPRYSVDKQDWIDTIEGLANVAHSKELFESDGVWVTNNELEKIKELNNTPLEKLAFTLLCLAKYYNQRNSSDNNWVYTEIKEIFEMAGISCSRKLRARKIGTLIRKGYIRYAVPIGNLNIQVLFADDDNDKRLLINDFRTLGNEYLYYNGGNYIRCAECGKLVKNNKYGNKKYCSECAAYNPQETKQVRCIDCGKLITIHSMNNETCRCDDCYSMYRKKYKAKKEKERRDRLKTWTAQF